MSTNTTSTKQLTEKGYQQTSYETVNTNTKFTLPIADSAKYTITDDTTPAEIQSQLKNDGYELVAPITNHQSLSAKVNNSTTDTKFYIKIEEKRVYIYPHDNEFNKQILKNVIESINKTTSLSHYNES